MKISKPKIRVKAPKVKVPVPKAISKAVSNIQKNVGTAATTALKSGGDFATQMAQSVGKGAQGTLGSAGDIAQSLVKGDIKGVASGGLGAIQNIKDTTKGVYGAYGNLATDALKATGEATGSEELTEASENIKREGNKALNQYGDVAMDIGANIATGGTYGLGKGALEATAEGGLSTKTLTDPRILAAAGNAAGLNPALAQQLSGVTSKDGIKNLAQGQVKDLALETVASKYGLDPSLTKTVGNLGLGAVTGDMKNAAIEAGAEMAGLSPDQTDIAKAGVSALSGDKSGMVSKLASTAGIQKDAANLLGSVAGGKDLKDAALQAAGSKLGINQDQLNIAKAGLSALSGGGDLRASALEAAGSYAGLDRSKMDLAKKGLSALSGDRSQLLAGLTPQMGDIQKFAMSKAGIDPNQLTKGLQSKLPANLRKMLPKLKMDQFKNFLPQKQKTQMEEPSMDIQQEQPIIPDEDTQQMLDMEPQMGEKIASFAPSSKIISEAMPQSFDMAQASQTAFTPKLKIRSPRFNRLREKVKKPAGFIKKKQRLTT